MVRTQIQLTAAQAAGLKELATARHTSMAEIIRQSVEDYLQHCGTLGRDERARRAQQAAGRFRSGLTDLSARHDDHLAEAYTG